MTDRLGYAAVEDRTMPAVVYGLYLVALATALPVLLGVIVAYVCRPGAGPAMRTHFDFQIRTFWMSVAWWIVGGLLILFGGVLSLVLIGLPFLFLGIAIVSLITIWYAIRTIVGVTYLARGEAYPRPYGWMV
jgi:uncharacterized membrane protein